MLTLHLIWYKVILAKKLGMSIWTQSEIPCMPVHGISFWLAVFIVSVLPFADIVASFISYYNELPDEWAIFYLENLTYCLTNLKSTEVIDLWAE